MKDWGESIHHRTPGTCICAGIKPWHEKNRFNQQQFFIVIAKNKMAAFNCETKWRRNSRITELWLCLLVQSIWIRLEWTGIQSLSQANIHKLSFSHTFWTIHLLNALIFSIVWEVLCNWYGLLKTHRAVKNVSTFHPVHLLLNYCQVCVMDSLQKHLDNHRCQQLISQGHNKNIT